jgi:hypothetical protein
MVSMDSMVQFPDFHWTQLPSLRGDWLSCEMSCYGFWKVETLDISSRNSILSCGIFTHILLTSSLTILWGKYENFQQISAWINMCFFLDSDTTNTNIGCPSKFTEELPRNENRSHRVILMSPSESLIRPHVGRLRKPSACWHRPLKPKTIFFRPFCAWDTRFGQMVQLECWNWFTDSLIHRLVGSLIHWFIDWLVRWFFDSLVRCFIDSLVRWFVRSWFHCFFDSSIYWLIDSRNHWFIASFGQLPMGSFMSSTAHCFCISKKNL